MAANKGLSAAEKFGHPVLNFGIHDNWAFYAGSVTIVAIGVNGESFRFERAR